MFRWLVRLLVLGLVLFVAVRVASRVLNREEDFDDFDDIDAGFEFTETPVEIDVPAVEAPASEARAAAYAGISAGAVVSDGSLLDVNGIGPTYAARLREAGISTLDDLAGADADTLASRVEVIGGRATIVNWIQQAQELVSTGSQDGAQSGGA
jgi:polyhydroxyalkanoate synthase subunit PhaC